jgi:hypothetical protein
MSRADEDPLMQGLSKGQPQAFAALCDRYAPSLFRVAWTLLRSRPDAEDAVQEVRSAAGQGCVGCPEGRWGRSGQVGERAALSPALGS